MLRQPLFHLGYRVRILKRRKLGKPSAKGIAAVSVTGDSSLDKGGVDTDASVIDLFGEVVFIPHFVRHGKLAKSFLYAHFGFNIALVVGFEGLPLFFIVVVEVTGSAAVLNGRSARLAKVADEVFTFTHLLLLKTKYRADSFKGKRKSHIC